MTSTLRPGTHQWEKVRRSGGIGTIEKALENKEAREKKEVLMKLLDGGEALSQDLHRISWATPQLIQGHHRQDSPMGQATRGKSGFGGFKDSIAPVRSTLGSYPPPNIDISAILEKFQTAGMLEKLLKEYPNPTQENDDVSSER